MDEDEEMKMRTLQEVQAVTYKMTDIASFSESYKLVQG